MSILRAKVAFLQRFLMGHHAMVVDSWEQAGVVLEGKRRLVEAFSTYSIEALEVAFVGRHFDW